MLNLPTSWPTRNWLPAPLLIAGFACYGALDASRRLRGTDKRLAARWWVGGSLAMGSGLWDRQLHRAAGF